MKNEQEDFITILSSDEFDEKVSENGRENNLETDTVVMAVEYSHAYESLHAWLKSNNQDFRNLIHKELIYRLEPFHGEDRHSVLVQMAISIKNLNRDFPISITEELTLRGRSTDDLETIVISQIEEAVKTLLSDEHYVEHLSQVMTKAAEDSNVSEKTVAQLAADQWLNGYLQDYPEIIGQAVGSAKATEDASKDGNGGDDENILEILSMFLLVSAGVMLVSVVFSIAFGMLYGLPLGAVKGAAITWPFIKELFAEAVRISIPLFKGGLLFGGLGLVTAALAHIRSMFSKKEQSLQSEHEASEHEDEDAIYKEICLCLDEMEYDLWLGDRQQAEDVSYRIELLLSKTDSSPQYAELHTKATALRAQLRG